MGEDSSYFSGGHLVIHTSQDCTVLASCNTKDEVQGKETTGQITMKYLMCSCVPRRIDVFFIFGQKANQGTCPCLLEFTGKKSLVFFFFFFFSNDFQQFCILQDSPLCVEELSDKSRNHFLFCGLKLHRKDGFTDIDYHC